MAVDPAQCRCEVAEKSVIWSIDRARSRDKHIIGSGLSSIQQDRRRGAAQPPLRPVAGYCIADLSACGEPDADRRDALQSFWPRRGLQNQTRHNRPPAGGSDTQEIGAPLERYKPAAHRFRGRSAWVDRDQRLRRIDVYGPSPAAMPTPCGPRASPCVSGTRGGACERGCWAGKCASRHRLRFKASLSSEGSYIGEPLWQVNAGSEACGGRQRSQWVDSNDGLRSAVSLVIGVRGVPARV